MNNHTVCMCPNPDCKNTRILYNCESFNCDFCKTPMKLIHIGNTFSMEKNAAEIELSIRGRKLYWLENSQVEKWPGPIALEYVRLKDIIFEGNIEGACWKIANLVEVVVSYFYAASFEYGFKTPDNKIPTLGNKVSKLKDYFTGKAFKDLISALNAIISWRNTFGVGHGSLASDKEFYIDSLLDLCQRLNQYLPNLGETLDKYGLSLRYSDGNEIIGYDYIYKIKAEGWNKKLFCRNPIEKTDATEWPILLFGHYFSCPDVFFLEHKEWIGGTQILQYKNYRKNKVKYLDNNKNFCWEKDINQVAWLNKDERASWIDYFKETVNEGYDIFVKKCITLVDAVTQFQSRGMHEEANQCKVIFEKNKHRIKSEENLHLKMALVNYCRHASLGKRNKAKKQLNNIEDMLKKLKDENIILRLKAAIDIGWYEGVSGDLDHGLMICEKGIEEAQEIKKVYPLSAAIDELELSKNMIYLSSRMIEGRDVKALKKQCIDLFYLSSRLYNYNLENRRIIDVLGYVCNLYGDFSMLSDNKTIDDNEQYRMIQLNEFGLKIRKKIYEMFPDDIWSIRGYAWSNHCRGRLAFNLHNNSQEAKHLLLKAREIRIKGEETYQDDLGIKEDLFENYLELINILPATEDVEELVDLCEQKLAEITRKEKESPRVKMLEAKIKCAKDIRGT